MSCPLFYNKKERKNCSFYAQIGSPNKVKTNPFPLGDGFAFVFRLKK